MGAAARSDDDDIVEDESAEGQDEQGAEGEGSDGSSTEAASHTGDEEEDEDEDTGDEVEEAEDVVDKVAVEPSRAPPTVAKEAARSLPRKTVQRHDTVSAPLTQAPSTGGTRKRLGEDDTTVKAKKQKTPPEHLTESDFAVEEVAQQKKPKSGSGKATRTVTTVCLRLFRLHCTMSFVRYHADF